jgi:hypothetical protein
MLVSKKSKKFKKYPKSKNEKTKVAFAHFLAKNSNYHKITLK